MNQTPTFWRKLKTSRIFQSAVVIVGFFLFVVLMDKVIMPMYVHLGDELEMPDVTEMTVEDATNFLEQQGFSVIVADSIYDANYPKGTVVEQNPYPFSRVKRGRHVYLVVSIGKKPIIMPNLFYKSPRDAELILKSYGLKMGRKNYEYNDFAVEGVVIGQSYPQGQKVKRGTRIDITISLGPFPTVKTVPEVVGKSLSAAKKQLRTLGLRNIEVEYEVRDNILPETVLKQSIKRGTPVEEGMKIVLTISKLPLQEEE
ncbi:MAG TPA: PASTA domain-containing protein [Calditrichaeota bacterium]|nr:PASTA domain-containing protein [Calditrichota bacterium]